MMRFSVTLLVGLCITQTTADPVIDIKGAVNDKDGNPVANAVASLKIAGKMSITGADGVFHITNNSPNAVLPQKSAAAIPERFMRGNELYLSLQKTDFVELALYTLNGRTICIALQQRVEPGHYRIAPLLYMPNSNAAQVAIAKLTFNNMTTCYKIQNTVIKRGETGLVRTDPATRGWLSKKNDAVVDTLSISENNQTITTSNLSSLVDSLPPYFIVQRGISGNFASKSVSIGAIVAILSGDDIPASKPIELWYNQPNNSFSGYMYFLKPATGVTKNYSVNVKVSSTDSLFVGQSQAVPFTSVAGDIIIPSFDPGNARPIVSAGKDTVVPVGGLVKLHGSAIDSFGGAIVKYEWDPGATGRFVQTSGPDTSFHLGMTPNPAWWCRFRATDNDGNKVVDSCKITISADTPVVVIEQFVVGGPDTTVSVNDSIAFRVAVSQQFGTSTLSWRFVNGAPASGTFMPVPAASMTAVNISSAPDSGSQTVASVPGYLIKTVAPSAPTNAYWIYVQATNNNGYARVDSVKVIVTGDTLIPAFGSALISTIPQGGWPVNFVSALSCSVGTSAVELVLCARQKSGQISKWEWSIDGAAFSTLTKTPATYRGSDLTAPLLSYIDTSITPAALAGTIMTVVLRVTNNTTVVLDTIMIQTGIWTSFNGGVPGSIYSAAGCISGVYDLIVNNSVSNLPIQYQKVVNYALSSLGGSIGAAWNATSPVALAFDDSFPVCAYMESTAGGIVVKNLPSSAGAWTVLGNPVDSMKTGKEIVLAVDNHNVYMAFTADNGKLCLWEYSGSSWDTLGKRYISDGAASSINLVVTGGTPYIAYKDAANGNKLTVQSYQDGAWTALGGKGISSGTVNFISLKLDGAVPWVAYQDSSTAGAGKLTVQKFVSSAWTTVGSVGISNNPASWVTLLISSGKYYVAYVENTAVGGGGTSVTCSILVKQFTGSSWSNLGTGTVISAVGKTFQNLSLVSSGGLYLYSASPVPIPPGGVAGPIKSIVTAYALK